MNPATPMRQVPGAYFNTPAPGGNTGARRRMNFNDQTGFGGLPAKANLSGSLDAMPQGPPATDAAQGGPLPTPSQVRDEVPPITKAAQSINQTLQLEESFPDLDSYCRLGASSDYDVQYADSAWAPFQRVQMYQIPDEIFTRLEKGEVHTRLGLFAEIGYAWAAIDSSLFLWDYSHPNPELIGFEDAVHTITAVAIVPPKAGVFVKTITHILVVATTSEIILLGLSATPTPSGSRAVTLYQTKMAVHRGGSDVGVIVGTASGRIFFGGDTDTDIYELFYQQEERWFSSRCGKVNHTHPGWSSVVPNLPGPFGQRAHEHLTSLVVDDTRNLLYSLSNKSTIRTYHMESPEKLFKVIEKDKNSCLRDITHMMNKSPLLNDRIDIVALSPIADTEASKLHLMALTNSGCRLFLSATSPSSYMMGATTNLAPQSMQVQFVKFPPKEQQSNRPREPVGQPAELDVSSRHLELSTFGLRFAPGYFFDSVRKGASGDILFVSTPDTGRIKATTPASALSYFEQGNWIELPKNSKTLDIGMVTKPFGAAKQPLGFGNELAVQFDQVPGEFAVLTNTGVQIIRRRRLVDIFATAIRGAAGDEGLEKEMRKFISQYGRVETIAAALAVACGQGSDLRTGTSKVLDQATEDRARSAFVDFGGQPRLAETDGNTITADSVRLSSRHDALALYLTRLIRMLWKSKVIEAKIDEDKGALTVTSNIPNTKLVTVQENVERLRKFLETNKGIIQGLAGPTERIASRQDEIALQKEHQALHSLRKLMESVSEGISFVLMLFDERVTDIYTRLDDTTQKQLQDLTFESLFSHASGKELAKVLVKAIVNRNIASGANVETVADALRRRCGSFCSPDDVVVFKAQEQLQRASEQVHNLNALRTLLAESLRLFEKVAGSLTSANLRLAVEQYIELKYYAGAITLCLAVAREKDRGNTALSWVNDSKPANDSRKKAFDQRKICYALIHETLDRLEAVSAAEPELVDGKLTLTATKRIEAYAVVNNSTDEVFHFDLYDWYIGKEWTDRILSIDSPHVITYLKRLAETDAKHADLLCRFYTHRSRFFEAAKVQADLAKSELPIGIKDRITLLSRAKGNASVNTVGISRQDQQFLNHEVTELLEIAHIQDDLLERLKADPRMHAEKIYEIEQALDGPIQGLSTLYNEYADQAGYFDLCLLIYHAADYQNPRSIIDTWSSLISETHHDIEQREQEWQAVRSGAVRPGIDAPPVSQPPKPYEVVISHIRDIAHRTSLDSLIFPVDALLPLVCTYAIENGQDASVGAEPCWPVLIFLQLGVPHPLILRVLESIFDGQEAPFTGKRRKIVVQWINAAVDSWVREVERRGTAGRSGDSTIGGWVGDLLTRMDEFLAQLSAGARAPADASDLIDARRVTRTLKASVDNIIGAERQGSLLYR
ncbi:Non-repetitive/WGA-negative nucleoporin C-terminal-domain-containing protein [Lasiosphaeria ovina]|uniref:Non-repetitive/WGA-negative nucleoporin C-terminal-domain-containing protein n=1 Tax=Lasiosphaeria ovina TaxID=92902 RepID=A0AAE0NCM7_9PEZI|nr:Non-repetitive/WGA-negative nucleoporin C-terminal-domain-containing protein [Lasiosphaeria ovina]